MKSAAFLATRSELVPTTRTASRGQVAQVFGKSPQCGKGALLCLGIKEFVGSESGGQPHRFAQSIQHVELVALHARDLQPKTV